MLSLDIFEDNHNHNRVNLKGSNTLMSKLVKIQG